MDEYLILVDKNDKPWGKLEKQLVHEIGILHRAFSIFLFNAKGELLMQQRAECKYHSPRLWTNTCCSHPQYGEELSFAVSRRLFEEMRLTCDTKFAFSFIYKASFSNGLTEHEFDHVYFGITNDSPNPDKTEVMNYKYVDLNVLEEDIHLHPNLYTEWLKICFPKVKTYYNQMFVKHMEEVLIV